jgi:hypothetical protein
VRSGKPWRSLEGLVGLFVIAVNGIVDSNLADSDRKVCVGVVDSVLVRKSPEGKQEGIQGIRGAAEDDWLGSNDGNGRGAGGCSWSSNDCQLWGELLVVLVLASRSHSQYSLGGVGHGFRRRSRRGRRAISIIRFVHGRTFGDFVDPGPRNEGLLELSLGLCIVLLLQKSGGSFGGSTRGRRRWRRRRNPWPLVLEFLGLAIVQNFERGQECHHARTVGGSSSRGLVCGSIGLGDIMLLLLIRVALAALVLDGAAFRKVGACSWSLLFAVIRAQQKILVVPWMLHGHVGIGVVFVTVACKPNTIRIRKWRFVHTACCSTSSCK